MTESATRPLVGITMGDPAGIGPEVIVRGYEELVDTARPVVIGDASTIRAAVELCEQTERVSEIGTPSEATGSPDRIDVIDLDNVTVETLERGVVDEAYGQASLEYVDRAIELAVADRIDAIATAPINKQSTRAAGSGYAGHTGMLADYTDTEHFTMLLIEEPLRVTHVSTHVPLRRACDLVTESAVYDTIQVTDDGLRELGIADPTIAVAGLNPHAGDDRLLGDEDADAIRPAIERAQTDGLDVVGPEPPDTVYVRAASGEFDCVVSMYHDQGHIPIKMLGFSSGAEVSGVNVTLGLPIVRTSVDHGTAFDIAGQGIASARSMIQATETAATLAQRRQEIIQ